MQQGRHLHGFDPELTIERLCNRSMAIEAIFEFSLTY
jgi:hypothetical protein